MGLMRAGLEPLGFETVYANDNDPIKVKLYRDNWGDLDTRDIRDVRGRDVPYAEMATASFPCTDVSLSGRRTGLHGEGSGLVFEFLRILDDMAKTPDILLFENVPGLLSLHGGRYWARLLSEVRSRGYYARHMVVDAKSFVPQSRARVFLIGHKESMPPSPTPPPQCRMTLDDIVDSNAAWMGDDKVENFLHRMVPLQKRSLFDLICSDSVEHRTAKIHGRKDNPTGYASVYEVRRDRIGNALTRSIGGAPRMVRAGRGHLDIRPIALLECARMMGAEHLNYGSVSDRQARQALGDAVCVPVVEWAARKMLMPFWGVS